MNYWPWKVKNRWQADRVAIEQNLLCSDWVQAMEETPEGIRLDERSALTAYCTYKRRLTKLCLWGTIPGRQSLMMNRRLLRNLLDQNRAVRLFKIPEAGC